MNMKKTILATLAIALATIACDPAPDNNGNGNPHQTTITAFGKEATVIGDAAISTADFNTAKGKLQEAMTALDGWLTGTPGYNNFFAMINRTGFAIIIGIGNVEPDADANKSMTIGIDYLLTNDANTTIAIRLNKIVVQDNAFADPYTPLYTNPATITLSFVTPSGTPATGNFNVTVKSDDAYQPNVWDDLVVSVKTALETTYASSDVVGAERASLRDVFGAANATVVLKDDLTTNWKVEAGATKGVLYIKTSAVSAITATSYAAAADKMSQNNSATSED
jgi:hypothetical protein